VGSPARILFVDDEPFFIQGIVDRIQHEIQTVVRLASTYDAAGRELQENTFDLVVLDALFPFTRLRVNDLKEIDFKESDFKRNLPGVLLFQDIRRGQYHASNAYVPVIFFSIARITPKEAFSGLPVQAQANTWFCYKLTDIKEILVVMKEALGHKWQIT